MAKLALSEENKKKLYRLCGQNQAAQQAVTAVIGALEFEFDELQPSPEDLHAALQIYLLNKRIINTDSHTESMEEGVVAQPFDPYAVSAMTLAAEEQYRKMSQDAEACCAMLALCMDACCRPMYYFDPWGGLQCTNGCDVMCNTCGTCGGNDCKCKCDGDAGAIILVLMLIVAVIALAFSYFWVASFTVAGALARRDESDETKTIKMITLLVLGLGGEALFWSQYGSVVGHDIADHLVSQNGTRTSKHYQTVETLTEIGGFLLLGLPWLALLGCFCACLRCEPQEAVSRPLLAESATTTASAVAWNESRQRLLSELEGDGVLQGFLSNPQYKNIVRAYMHLLFKQSECLSVPEFDPNQYPVAEAVPVVSVVSVAQQQQGLYSPVMTRNDDDMPISYGVLKKG